MTRKIWFDKMTPDLTKSGQGRIQADAHRNIEERLEAVEDGVESVSVPATPSSIGAASLTEPYVTISASSGLSAERVLTGTTNQITVTDGGANSTVTLSTPQNLHTAAVFQVERLGISGAATIARSIALFDADASAAVSIVAHATTTAHTLVLPAAQGAANSILVNDGSGNLSTTTAPRFTSVGINGASGSAQELKLYNAVGTDAITIRAVVALLTAHTLILPSAQGAANSVLGNDGSGNLGWYTGALTSSFVTTNSEGQLTSERVLTGTANQITVTDNGAGSTVVLSTPQNLDTAASFRVGRLGINGAAGTARSLAIFDSDGSDAVTITALAATVGYSLVLPGAQGGAGSYLGNDGSGNLSWEDFNANVSGSLGSITPSIVSAWTWDMDSGGALTFNGDWGGDIFLITLHDSSTANDLELRGDNIAGITVPRVQRFTDGSGHYVLVGGVGDPPASTFMGRVNRTAQVANIATTNLSDAHGAGMYAVDAVLECTTNAGGAGTLALTVGWTDDVGATTSTPIAAFPLTVTGRTTGRQVLYSTNGTITYAVAVTGIYSTAAYALRIRITYLG